VNFSKRESWRKKLRSEVSLERRKIVGAKWVCKIKDEQDGSTRHKGRIVSLGHVHLPGVDCTQSFSPVGNDTSARIVIGLTLFNNEWTIEVVDVEAAFLEGDMESTMHVEWPAGMVQMGFIAKEEQEERCVEQLKSMCGNSNAAIICFKLFKTHVIEEMGMMQSSADPCAFCEESEGLIVLVAVTRVDDVALGRSPEWIKWFKEGLKKRFGITDLGRLKKHLGVWHKWKNDT
jgi:hypothetical protein